MEYTFSPLDAKPETLFEWLDPSTSLDSFADSEYA
jgi:hypothetical protein